MKFTHLTNEAYPGLPDYNTGYQNEFDYSRYSAEVSVTLYRLNLDSNYNNVVAFDSVDERDEWFDSVSSLKLSLTLEKRLLPEDTLKIPVPFDVACLYNYIRITYQPVTSTSEMVEYESSSGFSDYYYFITDYICRAVNTTELALKRDEWMTFEPYCTFTYAQLNRGHYPLSKTSVSTYLASPIDNNDYILTPDVNFGAKSVVSYTNNVVLNDSTSYICFVTTSNPSSESWGDLDDYDAQVQVNASNATQGYPTHMVFAIDAENHSDFLVNVDTYYPWFKQTVLCVFLAPSDLVYISETFTFADITCYRLTAFYEYDETLLTLDKSQFGFDDDYADLTKLYTYPYSYIEIVDGNGTTHEIHIEDTCGTLDVRAYLAYSYPMIGVTAHVNGIGSSSTQKISYKTLSSKSMTTQGTWYDLLFSWNVPLFSIRQSEAKYNEFSQYYNRLQAETAYTNAYTAASNSASNAKNNAETSADASYTQAINSATTAQTNAQTSADSAYTQAYNSATTAQTNAQTSADAAYTNAVASAATAQGNANRSAEIAVTNTNNSADCATVNNALAVASNEACQSTSNTASSNITAQGVSLALKNLYNDIDLQEALLEADSEYTTATTAVNSVSNVVSSVTSGAMSSGLAGVASGLISGAISGVTNAANAVLAIDCSSDKASATISNMTDKAADANTYNLATVGYSNSAQTSNTDAMNTCTASQTLNNNSTMITNAENLCDVAEDNAQDTYDNAVSNATVSKNASYAVAANTYDNALTNAELAKTTSYTVAGNTYDTSAANALLAQTTSYTVASNNYDTAMANAALSMSTAESAVTNSLRAAKVGNPHLFGANSGSAQDTKPWLIAANVVTQSKSAIKQAGDTFLRYGYFYNGYVPLDGFNVMEHFTYWQCQDVCFYSTNGVPQTALNAIREILAEGVTVWSDPDEIGKVSIYDNE